MINMTDKCGVCGSERTHTFYNKYISTYYEGVKEKVICCDYCKNEQTKRENI